ncbi:MAG: rarD protein [Phenylobacterium sp.]|jgi:chloramphenicol-sensitive protein RarD|uniref:EamA family transporter RarD n=1 Tax=Phenylobacterium sp. TaxID=1871053 RepID=UPI00260FFB14|nr:EamA family transporter RarD [Phenylobacterium sp.]MDB5464639.1 rarD protein [Phenylobacterium sp.]MDB5498996.1 rarD protein [Phenylobacterium sp.]
MSQAEPGGESRLALAAGIGCYLMWGIVPLVFQAMGRLGISPWEILANRTVWALPMAFVFVVAARQGGQVRAALKNPRTMAWLALSALLIAANWSIYIWAVNSGRVLETSLGYYINPLIAMAAGALIFNERIDRLGALAIALAALGVAVQAVAIGRLPVVSLALAVSFGGYGIVRKRVAAAAQTGLLIECLLLAGPGLVYVLWLQSSGAGHLGSSLPATAWLLACGPVTAVPLVLFSWAARRIPLSSLGFLQFIGPTIAFFIGVAQGEAFTPLRAASFAFIWGGAAVFAYGAWRRSRPELRATELVEPAE